MGILLRALRARDSRGGMKRDLARESYLTSTPQHYVSYQGSHVRIYQRKTGIEIFLPYGLLERIVKKVGRMTLGKRGVA